MGNRPYQDKIIRVVEDMMYHGQRQLTITLPTGAGKTRIAVQLIYKTGNRRTITVLPSSEIFEQTCEKLDEYNVPYVRLEAGGRPDLSECNNLVAMSQTLARRKATDMFDHWSPEVIVIDEIHKLIGQHRAITQMWPGVPIIGMTATPVRLDGQNLSDITPFLVLGPTIKELQRDGFLVPSITYQGPAPDLRNVRVSKGDYESKTLEAAYEAQGVIDIIPRWWLKKAKGRKTICFTPGVDVSIKIAKAYNSYGIRAEHVDGNTKAEDRKAALWRLENHHIDVLCNVGLYIEGLDVPSISCVTLAQPTKSVSRYMQEVGRGLRLSPGKKNLIIIDHTNNTLNHGRVESDRDWQRGGRFLDVEMRTCRGCGAYTPADDRICLHCMWTDKAPSSRVSRVIQDRLEKRRSRMTKLRICPSWAGAVRDLWYDCERERLRAALALPNKELGVEGYTENRCRKRLQQSGLNYG
jgi:superfamily II DNA or RNA helicase